MSNVFEKVTRPASIIIFQRDTSSNTVDRI
jgi:hypothetical protein